MDWFGVVGFAFCSDSANGSGGSGVNSPAGGSRDGDEEPFQHDPQERQLQISPWCDLHPSFYFRVLPVNLGSA